MNQIALAAVVGLIGTWIGGTTIATRGEAMNYEVGVVATPVTFIVTLVWLALIIWGYREKTTRMSKYQAAIEKNPAEFQLDDFGGVRQLGRFVGNLERGQHCRMIRRERGEFRIRVVVVPVDDA